MFELWQQPTQENRKLNIPAQSKTRPFLTADLRTDTQELRRLLWGPVVDTFHGAADRPISRNNQQSAGRRALTLAQASPFSFCWRSVVGSET